MDLLIPFLRGAVVLLGMVLSAAFILAALATWRGRFEIERRPRPAVDAANRWIVKDDHLLRPRG